MGDLITTLSPSAKLKGSAFICYSIYCWSVDIRSNVKLKGLIYNTWRKVFPREFQIEPPLNHKNKLSPTAPKKLDLLAIQSYTPHEAFFITVSKFVYRQKTSKFQEDISEPAIASKMSKIWQEKNHLFKPNYVSRHTLYPNLPEVGRTKDSSAQKYLLMNAPFRRIKKAIR